MRYPKGMVAWVTEHYMEYTTRELTKVINERYGLSMNEKSVRIMKTRYRLLGAPRTQPVSKVWPKEIEEYICANYIGKGPTGMAADLQEKFGATYTRNQLKRFYANHHLNSGLTGRFEKGMEPINKGRKMSPEQYEKCKATMWKPGMAPHNQHKIGTMINRDGYWWTKIAQPNKWEATHRKMWREAYGEIPEGMRVIFKDGNTNNLNLENLMLVSLSEMTYMNLVGLRFEDPDVTETGVYVARLSMKAKKKGEKCHTSKKNV